MVIDGQGAVFTFDGSIIGGVKRAILGQSDSQEVAHRPLASDTTYWLPGQVSYGIVTLETYRNDNDPGQARLLVSRNERLVRPMTITLKDGTLRSFPAYTRTIPIAGGVDGVNMGNIIIRVSGKLTF